MQHEGELRSDIDFLMDVLRSNPSTRFTISKLHSYTGLPVKFLKKWVDVLAESGRLRFFYKIPDDEFSWLEGEHGFPQDGRGIALEAPQSAEGEAGHLRATYSRDELPLLLRDIERAVCGAKILCARVSSLKKSRVTDLAALGIARHMLKEKGAELRLLIREAKRLKG